MHKKKIIPALIGILFLLWMLSGINSLICHAEEVPVPPLTASDRGTDVVLVVDNSGTIWNKQKLRNSALRTAVHLAVGSDTRIGCVYFADHIYKYFSLTDVSDEASFKNVSEKYLDFTEQDINNMYTNIGRGLEKGIELFENQDENRRRIVIVLSDGINDGKGTTPYSYQQEADALTEQQTQILRDKNIELYCVAIDGGGQTDEDYLRQMVNYFDITNTYDKERCFWVKQDNLNELYDRFIHIFYSLRGDVRYSQVYPDAEGVYSFSLPQLNVKRVQAYVNTGDAKVTLSNAAGDQVVEWKEHGSTFVSADDPSPGEWTLQVLPSDGASLPDDTKVTLAYYTDLLASGSLHSADQQRDWPVKNKQVYIQAHLYDANGQKIVPDKAVKATARFVLKDDSQAVLMEKEFPLTVEEHSLVSEAFELTDYGILSMDLHIAYADAVSLDYHLMSEQEIGPAAPTVIKNFDGQNVRVEKVTKDGKEFYQFSVPLEEYIRDADSPLQQLRITGITQHNDHNPVSAHIDHEKLVIELQKCEPFSVYITFADEMNQTAELSVKGSVIDMRWDTVIHTVIVVLGCAAVVVVVFVIVRLWQKIKAKNDIIEIQEQIAAEINNIKNHANGAVNVASARNYQDAAAEVDTFLKTAHIFPEYLEELRRQIQGSEAVANDQEITRLYQTAANGLQQCKSAAIKADLLLRRPEAALYSHQSLRTLTRKQIYALREKKTELKKALDEISRESAQGYEMLCQANTDTANINTNLDHAADAVRSRLHEWKKRQLNFYFDITIDGALYAYAGKADTFGVCLSHMKPVGGAQVNRKASRVVFLAYQKTVTVMKKGVECEMTVPGLRVLHIHPDGTATTLVQEIDKGSRMTFTDPSLSKKVIVDIP